MHIPNRLHPFLLGRWIKKEIYKILRLFEQGVRGKKGGKELRRLYARTDNFGHIGSYELSGKEVEQG